MALSKQLHVPYASRENKILRVERSQGLEKVVSEQFAREHLVLPLFVEENVLAVAMAEPDDVLLQDNLRVMTRMEIQPFVATKTQIIKAIDEFYLGGGTAVIEKTMQAADTAGAEESEELEEDQKLDLDQASSGAMKRRSLFGQRHPQAGSPNAARTSIWKATTSAYSCAFASTAFFTSACRLLGPPSARSCRA